MVCAFLAHAHKEAIVGEARAQHQWKRRVCVASPSGGSSAATSAAVLAVDLFVGWVFLNITPHIAMRIKPWTVWGFKEWVGAHNHQRTNVAPGAGLRTPVSCAGLVRGRHTLAAARSLNLRVRCDVDRGRTVPTRCVGGAGKRLRGEGRGGGAGATYSTGRGERMIFRLRIHSRICVMLHRLPQQLLVRHAPVRVHACVRLCVHAHYRVRADVHVWV